MKKSYLAFLCLFGAWGASAQTVNVKPIGELQTTPALSTEFHKVENPIEGMKTNKLNASKSFVTNKFIPKAIGCVDTLGYPYTKQQVNNSSNFYYDVYDNTFSVAQVYKTGNTPLKINGLEFIIGKTTPDLNNDVTIRYSILQLNSVGTPTGTVLGSLDFTIAAATDTTLKYYTANFATPISLSSDFAIELKVITATEIKAYISDIAVSSTFDEQLLYANFGSGYSTIKSLYQSIGQNYDYDMIVHPFVSYDMDVPSFTATPSSGCTNTNVTLNATVSPASAATNRFLNWSAFSDYFNVGQTNATVITLPNGISNPNPFLYTNPTTYQYTTAGTHTPAFQYMLGFQSEDCFVQKTASITIDNPADATFSYGSVTTFCESATNETPTKTTNGGTFSATPAGLNFVSTSTGEIDFANSTAGTYTVQYAIVNGACTSSTTQTISVVSNTADATFSFAQNAYCLNDANPIAVLGTGATAGTFSSTTGLTVNPTTGEIDLANSIAGIYTITNTISPSGSCPGDVQTYSVTLNANPTVTLDAVAPLCVTASAVTLNATPNTGTFSGNGLTGNNFDPADAGVGNHTITYSVTENGCTTAATISIAVSNVETPDFTYANSAYCKNDLNPTVVLGTGATAGTFSATTGLTVNPTTGEIDLANSPAGSYTVTNTVNETNGCAVATATQNIEIKAIPAITFTMPATICVNYNAITLSATPAGGNFTGAGVSNGSFNPTTAGAGTHSVSYSVTENGCSNSETRSITVDECLGLNDVVSFNVNLFPVPATNDVTITVSENATAQIMNLEGKVIVDNINLSANTNNLISTENYARGMYLVKISVNGQAVIKKITLE
ncbi:MAG TPA: T9SS type A sorting domain-containing protein [Crocinitomicaceae bacterium]|nr:T9SS type A sorting domain-containing protein [Crocinitomicaceae bacterium]